MKRYRHLRLSVKAPLDILFTHPTLLLLLQHVPQHQLPPHTLCLPQTYVIHVDHRTSSPWIKAAPTGLPLCLSGLSHGVTRHVWSLWIGCLVFLPLTSRHYTYTTRHERCISFLPLIFTVTSSVRFCLAFAARFGPRSRCCCLASDHTTLLSPLLPRFGPHALTRLCKLALGLTL